MSNELLIPGPLTADIFATDQNALALVGDVEKRVQDLAAPLDVETSDGRKEIASLAYRVARSKTAVEDLRKAHTADLVKKKREIDALGGVIWDRLEALQKKVRQPLTDWEDAEEHRRQAHDDAITAVTNLGAFASEPTTMGITGRLVQLEPFRTRNWEECAERAKEAIERTCVALAAALHIATKREEERAELERLRAADKARQEKEAAETAAAAAAKAEAARIAREEQIAKEAAAAAERRAREAEEQRVALEAQNEARRKSAHEAALTTVRAALVGLPVAPLAAVINAKLGALDHLAKRDWQEFKGEAEAAISASKIALEELLREAEARIQAQRDAAAQAAANRARQEEQERAAQAEAAQRAEQAAREADVQNRRAKNREVAAALVDYCGLEPPIAQGVVSAIARSAIPHVKIEY
jgi:colicin import membrane protein